MKKALVTGITGQDGSYLAEFLLDKGYEVHGVKRRASSFNTDRINHIFEQNSGRYGRFKLHYGELTDFANMISLVQKIQPDEIYNLGAQSHVKVSFETPEYTGDVDGLGALRLLEAVRLLGLNDKTRFYQASTSELFGNGHQAPQNEKTPFYPRSPYACAKLYAYWITVNYREAYGIYACNGILFNHESPRRGETFVTRKITRGLCRSLLGVAPRPIALGNLNAMRDWGHAKDYVAMMWLMLQQNKPEDYVIATGRQISVREFVTLAAARLGIAMQFDGQGSNERGIITGINRGWLHTRYGIPPDALALKEGDCILQVDPMYFRPAEVETLLGDARLAHERLGWEPTISVEEMVEQMVDKDMEQAMREKFVYSATN